MTDKAGEVYGICLRGKAGWGENMAFLSAMSNSFGAKWFDMDWKPQIDYPPLRIVRFADKFLRDGVETHDCFTTTEYVALDHLGLTAPGRACCKPAQNTGRRTDQRAGGPRHGH